MTAEIRPFANVPTDELRARIIRDEKARLGRELAERQARLMGPDGGTDLLRAAAQGIAAHLRAVGGYVELGCSCLTGCEIVTVSPYSFDENGRIGESQLWAIVRVMEHITERGTAHTMQVVTR